MKYYVSNGSLSTSFSNGKSYGRKNSFIHFLISLIPSFLADPRNHEVCSSFHSNRKHDCVSIYYLNAHHLYQGQLILNERQLRLALPGTICTKLKSSRLIDIVLPIQFIYHSSIRNFQRKFVISKSWLFRSSSKLCPKIYIENSWSS